MRRRVRVHSEADPPPSPWPGTLFRPLLPSCLAPALFRDTRLTRSLTHRTVGSIIRDLLVVGPLVPRQRDRRSPNAPPRRSAPYDGTATSSVRRSIPDDFTTRFPSPRGYLPPAAGLAPTPPPTILLAPLGTPFEHTVGNDWCPSHSEGEKHAVPAKLSIP